MRILARDDVRRALPMRAAIDAMRAAFRAFAERRIELPLRGVLRVPPHDGTTLVMPSFIDDGCDGALAVKVVSVFPRNPARGLPLIHAAVLVLEAATGRAIALLEGGTLTAIRTGAVSGLATELLARPESRVVAVLGCGVQARTQLEAVCSVRSIEEVRVWGPTRSKAEVFAAEMAGQSPVPKDIQVTATAEDAVAAADIVCTATTSATPVFEDEALRPGTHINAIGSFRPEVREVPGGTVARALIAVESREAALEEAGDLIQPIREGLIDEALIALELGELVLGRAQSRRRADEITLFKSVGLAIEDAAAARVALETAERERLGQLVRW